MSIHISDGNVGLDSAATRFDLPSGAGNKAANTAATFGIFFQSPEQGGESSVDTIIATRQTGGTGGNDIYFNLPQACTSLKYAVRNTGSALISDTSLAGLTAGVKYLLLFIVNPTNVHIVVAPVDGGTILRATHNISTVYAANMSDTGAVAMINRFGGGTGVSNKGFSGPLENAFMCVGTFPESGGVPDATLITNLATGAQAISGLAAQMTSGANRFHYPMLHSRDLSDAFGLAAALTTTNEDKPSGKFHFNGRMLRPASMMPDDAEFVVSQAMFGTVGDTSTAKADVPVQGGTYSGITPAAIQARLVKEDGTTHVDWTTIDAAPAGGSWAAGTLSNVAMVAGILHLDIRAVDGSNNLLGSIVSGGIRGVGFHLLCAGQSQMMYMHETGNGLAITSGIRLIHDVQKTTGGRRALLGSAASISRRARRGVRQAAIEINALFPGVPIQFSAVGEAGTAIDEFLTGGSHVARWGLIADRFGVIGRHYFAFMGHSSSVGSDYETKFTDMMALADAALGAQKVLCLPVYRYKRAGSTLTLDALAVHYSRTGMRAWHEDNRDRSFWGSSFSPMTSETGEASNSSDPHPEDTDMGQGREGATMAWVGMSACRAIPDEIVGIIGATGLGTDTVTLEIGRINNAPS